MFDYSKLRGRIVEKYNSQACFAKEIGMSQRTLSLKMQGKRVWRQDEICTALLLLDLKEDDIHEYFFKTKVQ